MKIRTDFVTNSSSSSFVTIRFRTAGGECAYSVGMDFELPEPDEALEQLAALNSVQELMDYFGISEDDLLFTGGEPNMEEFPEKIRFAEGSVLGGEDAWGYLEDMGADPDSDELPEGVVTDFEGNILCGSATVFDLKNRTVSEENLDEDDGYGA